MFAPGDAEDIVLAGVGVALEEAGLGLDLIRAGDFDGLPPFGVSVGGAEADFGGATGENPLPVCMVEVDVFATRETPPKTQREWLKKILSAVGGEDAVRAAMDAEAADLGWSIQRMRVVSQRQEVSEGVRSFKTDLEVVLEAGELPDESDSESESE